MLGCREDAVESKERVVLEKMLVVEDLEAANMEKKHGSGRVAAADRVDMTVEEAGRMLQKLSCTGSSCKWSMSALYCCCRWWEEYFHGAGSDMQQQQQEKTCVLAEEVLQHEDVALELVVDWLVCGERHVRVAAASYKVEEGQRQVQKEEQVHHDW